MEIIVNGKQYITAREARDLFNFNIMKLRKLRKKNYIDFIELAPSFFLYSKEGLETMKDIDRRYKNQKIEPIVEEAKTDWQKLDEWKRTGRINY